MVLDGVKQGSLVRGRRLSRHLRCDRRLQANMVKRVRSNIPRLGRKEDH